MGDCSGAVPLSASTGSPELSGALAAGPEARLPGRGWARGQGTPSPKWRELAPLTCHLCCRWSSRAASLAKFSKSRTLILAAGAGRGDNNGVRVRGGGGSQRSDPVSAGDAEGRVKEYPAGPLQLPVGARTGKREQSDPETQPRPPRSGSRGAMTCNAAPRARRRG